VLPKNTLGLMPGRIELIFESPIDNPGALPIDLLMKQVEEKIRKGLNGSYGKLT